jgi:hypothetical protein
MYATGPSSSIAFLVSSVGGVEANSQTPPFESLTATERPPSGKIPNLVNGLEDCVRMTNYNTNIELCRECRVALDTYLEKMVMWSLILRILMTSFLAMLS